jgi:hypothetical protein
MQQTVLDVRRNKRRYIGAKQNKWLTACAAGVTTAMRTDLWIVHARSFSWDWRKVRFDVELGCI